ncbi:MAG: hypothetical protein R3301_06245 [Saprospiraceae bacterium]|nr:hypothetical protein [Saprospiraceae bacterium]
MRPLLLCVPLMLVCEIHAQTELTSLLCHDAIEVCLEGLGFQTVELADVGHPDYCTPNSLIHNPRYLAFTPTASTIEITLEVTGCTSGSALQYAIIDTCEWTNDDVIACDPFVDDLSVMTVNDLMPGKKYYLMVEGANAAICGFRVTITNITGGVFPGELGPLMGPDVFTPGQTLELTLPEAIQDAYYLWSIPWLNHLIATPSAVLTIMVPVDADADQYEICVTPAAGCDAEVCITILVNQVDPDLTTLTCQEAVEFCPNGLVFQTQLLPDVGHPGFCGPNTLIHNPRYLKFKPIDSTASLLVEIIECTLGTALQYAVIDTCDWSNENVIACDPGFNGTSTRALTDLIPGKSYYLVVDGSNAARCSYAVTLTGIGGGHYPGVIDTIVISDPTADEGTVEFVLGPGSVPDASYVWDISWLNRPLTTDTAYLKIETPCTLRPVEHTICVHPVIGCLESVCAAVPFEALELSLPLGDTSVTITLPPYGQKTILASDLVPIPMRCTQSIEVSFDQKTRTPARTFNCAALQANGGPFFLEDLWISDAYGNQVRVPVTVIVRDTSGHCLPADVPRDTLQIDTSGLTSWYHPMIGRQTPESFTATWFPNPWHQTTTLYIRSNAENEGVLTILNGYGGIVHQQNLAIVAGSNQFTLHAEQVNHPGLLFWHISMGSNTKSGKFLTTN